MKKFLITTVLFLTLIGVVYAVTDIDVEELLNNVFNSTSDTIRVTITGSANDMDSISADFITGDLTYARIIKATGVTFDYFSIGQESNFTFPTSFGTDNQILKIDGTVLSWEADAGGGGAEVDTLAAVMNRSATTDVEMSSTSNIRLSGDIVAKGVTGDYLSIGSGTNFTFPTSFGTDNQILKINGTVISWEADAGIDSEVDTLDVVVGRGATTDVEMSTTSNIRVSGDVDSGGVTADYLSIGNATNFTFPTSFGVDGEILKISGTALSWEADAKGGGILTGDADARYVQITGDTMTGNLVVSADVTVSNDLWARGTFRLPVVNGNVVLTTTGDVAIDSNARQIAFYDGQEEIAIPSIHILKAIVDPGAWFDSDDTIWLLDLHSDRYPNGIVITKWFVDTNVANPSVTLDMNLMSCDADTFGNGFPGANTNVIDVLDVTAGQSSEDVQANIGNNGQVFSGKSIYLSFDADPEGTATQMSFRMHYYIPED